MSAYDLTSAAGTIARGAHAKAATTTIRRRIIKISPRIATTARRITVHLPTSWLWKEHWQAIFDATHGRQRTAPLGTPPNLGTTRHHLEHPEEPPLGAPPRPPTRPFRRRQSEQQHVTHPWIQAKRWWI